MDEKDPDGELAIRKAEELNPPADRLNLIDLGLRRLSPRIAHLIHLKELYTSENQLSDLPPEIGALQNLTHLYLQKNSFRRIPKVLSQLRRLQYLDLSYNSFEDISGEDLLILQYFSGELSLMSCNIANLPAQLASLQYLSAVNLKRNRLAHLPKELADWTAPDSQYVQRGFPPFLYLEGNPLPKRYLDVAQTLDQPQATKNVLSLLAQEVEGAPANSPGLPELPSQAFGPHFEIRDDGVVDFVPASDLDAEGNNVARLQTLQPMLQELIKELLANLGGGNSPHFELHNRLVDYESAISRPLNEINFGVLYGLGVRYANALKVAEDAVPSGDLPPLGPAMQERAKTFQQYHSVFISATAEGSAMLDAEMRYRRRPAEERDYRQTAVEFAEALRQHPEIMAPEAAKFIQGAAADIGQGPVPERSGTMATGSIRNASIVIASAAIIGAMPVAGFAFLGLGGTIVGGIGSLIGAEALKQSRPFKAIRDAMTGGLDNISDLDVTDIRKRFQPHVNFMRQITEKVRRISSKDESLRWLRSVAEWLAGNDSTPGETIAQPSAVELDIVEMVREQLNKNVANRAILAELQRNFPSVQMRLGRYREDGFIFALLFPSEVTAVLYRVNTSTGYKIVTTEFLNRSQLDRFKFVNV